MHYLQCQIWSLQTQVCQNRHRQMLPAGRTYSQTNKATTNKIIMRSFSSPLLCISPSISLLPHLDGTSAHFNIFYSIREKAVHNQLTNGKLTLAQMSPHPSSVMHSSTMVSLWHYHDKVHVVFDNFIKHHEESQWSRKRKREMETKCVCVCLEYVNEKSRGRHNIIFFLWL